MLYGVTMRTLRWRVQSVYLGEATKDRAVRLRRDDCLLGPCCGLRFDCMSRRRFPGIDGGCKGAAGTWAGFVLDTGPALGSRSGRDLCCPNALPVGQTCGAVVLHYAVKQMKVLYGK